MSVADHFEHTPDAGFVRDYDSESARRQFRVSVVLIAVIAFAAISLGLLIRFDNPSHVASNPDVGAAVQTQATPAYAGKL